MKKETKQLLPPFMAKNGKIQTFSTVRKSLNTHGTLSVYLLCRLLTVSCFQKKKNRFGKIVNSGSQCNSKVQSTLIQREIISVWSNFKLLSIVNQMKKTKSFAGDFTDNQRSSKFCVQNPGLLQNLWENAICSFCWFNCHHTLNKPEQLQCFL